MSGFGDCHTASLHLTDLVQAHGAVVVVNDEGIVVGASVNTAQLLGCSHTDLLDSSCLAVLPQLKPVLSAPEQGGQPGRNTRLWKLGLNGSELSVAMHRNGSFRFLEFEHPSESNRLAIQGSRDALFEQFLVTLEESQSARSAAHVLLDNIADIVEFDRAMLVQRQQNGHYQVIAERTRPGVASYKDHHFPGTDIPPNAQRLYLLKRQRFIANAWQEPVKLVSVHDQAFDLTGSELRAVHPVHIQYMRNMGTASSFSVSIVVNKVLWGMVVCHNLQPAALSFHQRQACLHSANVAGLHMSSLIVRRVTLRRHRQEQRIERLRQKLFSQTLGLTNVKEILHALRGVFRASGALLVHERSTYRYGRVPEPHAARTLLKWLQNNQTDPVFAADTVVSALAGHQEIVQSASGVLSINYAEGHYLVLLRGEYRQSVQWAGQPGHLDHTDNGLGPRTSFETWQELTRGRAHPWDELDMRAASDILRMFTELMHYRSAEKRSYTDALTGLGNRAWLAKQGALLLAQQPGEKPQRFALLLLDLDDFKPINDRYGHFAGDQVLIQLARRLEECVRHSDHVTRLGGDEFVLLLTGVRDPACVCELASRVITRLQEPFTVQGEQAKVVASIGIAWYPDHGDNLQALLHHADKAMYQAKQAGKGVYRVFDGLGMAAGS